MLQQKIISAERLQQPFALALLDLDNFKDINDTQGHACGDQILLQIAQRLSTIIGDLGSVGRFGGDEFVILFEDATSFKRLQKIIYQILETIKTPIAVSGVRYIMTASIGISLFPSDSKSPSVLLSNADQAMYVAKHSGRDRFAFFTPGNVHLSAK